MSGVQMSDFISKIGHLDPRFYSLIYCDTGGPDVGGPDVGGPDVGGPDVGGPDVRFPFCYYERLQKLELEGSDSLVRHAYSEQRHLKLAWYNKLTEL